MFFERDHSIAKFSDDGDGDCESVHVSTTATSRATSPPPEEVQALSEWDRDRFILSRSSSTQEAELAYRDSKPPAFVRQRMMQKLGCSNWKIARPASTSEQLREMPPGGIQQIRPQLLGTTAGTRGVSPPDTVLHRDENGSVYARVRGVSPALCCRSDEDEDLPPLEPIEVPRSVGSCTLVRGRSMPSPSDKGQVEEPQAHTCLSARRVGPLREPLQGGAPPSPLKAQSPATDRGTCTAASARGREAPIQSPSIWRSGGRLSASSSKTSAGAPKAAPQAVLQLDQEQADDMDSHRSRMRRPQGTAHSLQQPSVSPGPSPRPPVVTPNTHKLVSCKGRPSTPHKTSSTAAAPARVKVWTPSLHSSSWRGLHRTKGLHVSTTMASPCVAAAHGGA